MNNNNKDSMKKDLTGLIVLILLGERDMYGYELAQFIYHRSGNRINIKEGTLYPSLHKLKQQECISSYNELAGPNDSKVRVYYHLEEKGKQYLEELLPDYISLTEGIYQIINWNTEGSNSNE